MGIPDPNLEKYVLQTARDRAAELVTLFAAQHGAGTDAETICTHAGALFEDYCAGVFNGLRNAVLPVDAAEARWVRGHYVALMVEFAIALRDSIADSKARHAAAQLIQCKVLEHERELRVVLESPSTAAHTAELASVTSTSSGSPAALNSAKNKK